MAQKRINPDKMEALKARYDDMSDTLSDSVSYTDDDSQKLIDEGTKQIKSLSKNIVSTVDALDGYLNSVAQAFREADLKISDTISGGLQTYRTSNKDLAVERKQADLSQNTYYSKLP